MIAQRQARTGPRTPLSPMLAATPIDAEPYFAKLDLTIPCTDFAGYPALSYTFGS
jgi:hypothetical protein